MDKSILIAVDNSKNALKPVTYVGKVLGRRQGFSAEVFHVIPEPEVDYFRTPQEREEWKREYKVQTKTLLENSRRMLIHSGFRPNKVSACYTPNNRYSVAECILMEQHKSQFSTIVVGRNGISKMEEFLFGSVSSKILKQARDCAVWVVE